MMIELQKVFVQSVCLTAHHQDQGDTRLTLTSSVIPNSNFVIMASD
jgi:6-phosphogluconolactonase/glucosamine-6-phosphate isomerase/deaminase